MTFAPLTFHTQKLTELYQSSDYVDSSISSTNITLCSINVCGLNSKIKYKTLQEYITETKCNKIEENEIKGYTVNEHNINIGGFTAYVYL